MKTMPITCALAIWLAWSIGHWADGMLLGIGSGGRKSIWLNIFIWNILSLSGIWSRADTAMNSSHIANAFTLCAIYWAVLKSRQCVSAAWRRSSFLTFRTLAFNTKKTVRIRTRKATTASMKARFRSQRRQLFEVRVSQPEMLSYKHLCPIITVCTRLAG